MTSVNFFFVASGVDPIGCLEDAISAEKAGFNAVWVPDHYVDVDCERLEPWTMLSAIAARTKKIRLGSGVTDTQRTHPTRHSSYGCLLGCCIERSRYSWNRSRRSNEHSPVRSFLGITGRKN